MVKDSLQDRIQIVISQYKTETDSMLEEVTDRVFDSRDIEMISAYHTLANKLHNSPETGFTKRLEYLNEHIEDVSEPTMITYQEAWKFWKSYDKEKKQKPISNGGYALRVTRVIEKSKVHTEKKEGQILISKKDFINYIKSYTPLTKKEQRKMPKARASDYIPYRDAWKELRQADIEMGKKPVTDRAYMLRLNYYIKRGILPALGEGDRKDVYKSAFLKLKKKFSKEADKRPILTLYQYSKERDAGITNEQIREKFRMKSSYSICGFAVNYLARKKAQQNQGTQESPQTPSQ